MHSRYDQRSDPYGAPARRDDRHAPPSQSRGRPEYTRERSPHQLRDRYAPYPSHYPPAESNGYRNNDRRYSPPPRSSGRYGEPPPSRHAARPPPRPYTPPPAHQPSSRRYNDHYEREEPPRLSNTSYPSRREPPPQQSYPSSRDYNPPSRDYNPPSRDYNPPSRDYRIPPSRSYRPPPPSYRDPSTKPPPRAMSPVRGELLPTTVKFMLQQRDEAPPSRYERRGPPEYSDRSYPARRDEPRSRPPPRYDDRRPAPTAYRPSRGSRPYRSRGGSTRGGRPPRIEVSPIRVPEGGDQERNGDSPQKRPRPSTPSRSRSRTITPPEKVQANDFKRNGHQRILSQEEEEEDMLDFEDEIDPAIVEEAAKVNVQRLQIKPPDVDDLNLKDEAGGEMAEINERASTSVDCPLSPSSTVSEEIRYLSADSFDKISSYVQGQVDTSVDDYKILEEMNKTTSQRYQDMHTVAETISTRLKNLGNKYEILRPQLDQIEQIDEVSKRLENTVGVLEKYFNSLESKFKQIRSSPTRSQN